MGHPLHRREPAGGPLNLIDVIAAEIARSGPIAYGRFIDLALYHPTLGFYAEGGAGRRRDFITSPEVGPLFGAVMARFLDATWQDLGSPGEFSVVEAGAGTGALARSILAAKPECAAAMRYQTVEVSEAQRARHPAAVESFAQLPPRGGVGVVIANELLDNLAFDLYGHDGVGWSEIRVDVDADLGGQADGRDDGSVMLVERAAAGGAAPPWLQGVDVPAFDGPAPEGARVPDQYAARAWLALALDQHDHGRVLAIDYAVDAYPVDLERRWLRTYRDHDHGSDPLDRPGTQDITVDVALDQLARVRPPDRVAAQVDWLRHHGIDELVEEGRRIWNQKAAAPDVAALTARSRIGEAEALCDPAGLGAFRVLEWDL